MPTGRAGARRAGVTALVTAALALLLAFLFHLGVAAVAVAILGGLPAAFLAWAALPGTVTKPAHGQPVRRWDPVKLGVHQVIGGGPMPAYVRRPHDELLRAVLDPAVPASRLVVVRGGSSTGKTRAAYEAVADRLAGWKLDYPQDPAALKERLDAGIPARTVLWLGELRQYADADGGAAVLGRLADLLEGDGRLLLITTMWPEQWNAYTAAARAGPGAADPVGTAGRLLEPLPKLTGSDPAEIDPARGGVIDVPDQFAAADLEAAARTGDPLLAEAAAAAAGAGQDGQLTQYLAGVPDLLRRYDGPGGDPYGQAVITAAMDATRLGHASPLPAALVQDAAVGYLTGPQRTEDIASWRDTALDWATAELMGAVRALQPVPPASGTGVAGYQVADYLDQHGRRTRQDQLGPPSLWDALTAHATSASDLTRLGQAARDRGLYRHAAALWTSAALWGAPHAACQLITHLRRVSPGDTTRAAQWAAGQARLDDPLAVAWLLQELREAGDSDAVTALLARDPAGQARLDDPRAVALLLQALREAGASDAVTALAARAAGQAASTTRGRRRAAAGAARGRAGDAVTALLARDRRPGPPRRPGGRRLAAVGAARGRGQRRGHRPGRPGRRPGPPRRPGGRRRAAAGAARGRRHGDAVPPCWPATRRPGPPGRPEGRRLAAAGAARGRGQRRGHRPGRPGPAAARPRLDDPGAVASLLQELREAGDSDAVTALATRAANAGMFDLFLKVRSDEASSYRFGREPDGAPSQSWRWQEPTSQPHYGGLSMSSA